MMQSTHSILANSLPRGGPFLLGSALQYLGYRKYVKAGDDNSPAAFNYLEAQKALQGKHPKIGKDLIGISPFAPCYVEPSMMADWLSKLESDEYIPAHIPWSPALPAVTSKRHSRHIVIIRDPRSLLLSLLFDTHPMPRFLIKPFENMKPEKQLEFMLSGGRVPKSKMDLQAFATVYRSMLKWQDASDCLMVRYEDLCGPLGGGSVQQQQDVLKRIASFVDLPMPATSESILDGLATITDPSVETFRTDQLPLWKESLGEQIVERVIQACQSLADEAGYGDLTTEGVIV